MSETTRITTLDGDKDFMAYVAQPEGEPRAAIVVIQEIFGVNAGIRRKCDLLAEEGYLAVAPDLFWRLGEGIELDPDIEPEFQKALDLMGKFDQDAGVKDIEATIKWAREDSGKNQSHVFPGPLQSHARQQGTRQHPYGVQDGDPEARR